VLLDVPDETEPRSRKPSCDSRAPSPTTPRRLNIEKNEPSDLYGMQLLMYLAFEIQCRVRSRLVVPVAVLRDELDVSLLCILFFRRRMLADTRSSHRNRCVSPSS